MTINLSPTEMYGHWTHCEPKVCEFQHGTTMIYVCYGGGERSMAARLAAAQATIEMAFKETKNALEFARHISENLNSGFWQNANRIPLKQSPLIVLAIRYPIDSDLPIYEISWNPIFESETGVALSEDWVEEQVRVERLPENNDVIYVRRLGAGHYVHVA